MNTHQQQSAGPHQKKIPHVQQQRRDPSNGRRGEVTLKIEPHTRQRRLECSDKPCAHQDPETPEFSPVQSSSVQSLSRVRLFVKPWTTACQASLSITNSWSLLKLMSTESVMPSNHLILCCPLLFPPSILPSIRVFFNESVLCIKMAKVLEFQLQHQSFQ